LSSCRLHAASCACSAIEMGEEIIRSWRGRRLDSGVLGAELGQGSEGDEVAQPAHMASAGEWSSISLV